MLYRLCKWCEKKTIPADKDSCDTCIELALEELLGRK